MATSLFWWLSLWFRKRAPSPTPSSSSSGSAPASLSSSSSAKRATRPRRIIAGQRWASAALDHCCGSGSEELSGLVGSRYRIIDPDWFFYMNCSILYLKMSKVVVYYLRTYCIRKAVFHIRNCSLDVLHGEQGTNFFRNFCLKKDLFYQLVKLLQFLVIKFLNLDPHWHKMLETDRDPKPMRFNNTAF